MPVLRSRSPRAYQAYGLRLKSVITLPSLTPMRPGPAEVELVRGSASIFSRVYRALGSTANGSPWFQHARLPDGSDYLRWSGLFEFVIAPDGRRIACRSLDGATHEAFQTYLLSQVLSFALLKQEIESLHSTAVVVGEGAVGFVGDCGYGKSSLGAAFLQAGYPLLTDDLLVIKVKGGGFDAYPGPPRIKLFPQIARRLLGEQITGTPMNNLTRKLVIPLGWKMFWRGAAPLKAIYVLLPRLQNFDGERITIKPLCPRRAFVELLRNTFNAVVVDPIRLRRQFELVARLTTSIPVRSLAYPRRLDYLPKVRQAILSDLGRLTPRTWSLPNGR